jgi:large subunit ribosomal protein L30
MANLAVTQIKSAIGVKPKHRGTLRALGLRGIGSTNHLPDRPEIRGMIARVPHLVRVVEVQPSETNAVHGQMAAGQGGEAR